MTDPSSDVRGQLQAALGDAYTIERELGGGGMSRVFVASERALGRSVVIKVIAPELGEGLSADRFTREVKLAARLQQANIVPLLNAGDANGLAYYTMPFVEGSSLRTRLETLGPLAMGPAIHVLRDVAKALAYAHAHGVVHRDIKPENVLLSGGTAMVIDFGIAKAIASAKRGDRPAGDSTSNPSESGLTLVGTSLGTPAYMAPEQAVGSEVDLRADLYSWGVVAYELLTGAHPFADRKSTSQMVAAHIAEIPVSIAQRNPAIPASIANIVGQCLEKEPSARPASADDLLAALDDASGPALSTPPSRSMRSRVLIGGVSALILIPAAWLLTHRPPRGEPGQMTLAVLPIENLGGDSTTEYLADGMTGELANALKKMPGLQVAGDLSTFRFKRSHAAPAEIARQLGVRLLLSGKLQPGSGRVRLQMQLSQPDGHILWSQTYDRESKDNFAMQDDITSAIASEMRMVLSPTTVAVARAGRTTNPQAHDLYLRGVFEKNKITPEGLQKALAYFQDALKLDPNYAQAHAGVAFVYDILADVYMPSHEFHTLSLAAAERAVESDSLLAEARVLRGYEIAAATWDFAAGRAEMERGLAMNPNSQDGLFMRGLFAYLTGENARAVTVADKLIQLDPLSPLAARLRAEALAWGGRNDEALRADSVARRLDSTVVIWEVSNGIALLEMGRLAEAEAAFKQFETNFGQPSVGLALTYGRMGKRDKALEVIHALEARERRQWVDPNFIAIAYAGIGDVDHAMQWLETSFRKKTFSLRAFVGWDMPWLRSVRSDPRFVDLKRRVLATTLPR